MFLGPSFGFTEDKMLIVFGFLLMFYAAASGSQSQDPVECGFTESDICYVSWGQQVHLSIPSVDVFNLIIKNRTILRYRKSQTNPPKPNSERWQFNTETNTLILTSAEWSDFGTYNLETFDAGGTYTGNYNLTIYMKDLTVIILSSVCVSLIVLAVSGFFVYKKIRRLRKKKEWWPKGTQTKPSEVPAPVEDVNYALVVTQPASQRNLEKRADDVHYTELMFPSQERSEIPEGQDKCVYSQIQYDP